MERGTKKATIIVAVLFIYMAGMTIWGYSKQNVTGTEAILYMAGMCVVLVLLWFAYRKRDEMRNKRKDGLK